MPVVARVLAQRCGRDCSVSDARDGNCQAAQIFFLFFFFFLIYSRQRNPPLHQ